MKRSWQEDPVYATEIESAMNAAAEMFDRDEGDDDDWKDNFSRDEQHAAEIEAAMNAAAEMFDCDEGDDDWEGNFPQDKHETEIEAALNAAAEMFDCDEGDDDWEDNFSRDKECDDDEDDEEEEVEEEEEEEDEELNADYVKEHFDRLYVQKLIGWIEEGKNVFVTGSPGRGKSTCISRVIKELYGKGVRLIATGSTGVATVNIGHDALEELLNAVDRELLPSEMAKILSPTTVHSAFGLRKVENDWLDEHRKNGGTIQSFMRSYVDRHRGDRSMFLKRKRELSCWNVPAIAYASLVILDEVSMADELLVETLDKVGRFWHPENKRPFGGLRMVFVGDFQQLPPVGSGTRQNPILLFEKKEWTTPTSKNGWVDRVLHLKTNIRQEGDLQYGKLLDRMTMNALSTEDIELLQKCVLKPANGCRAITLAMNPYVMPFVPRIFTRKDHITSYTQKVLREVDEEAKITLTVREEYEPSKESIYLAYGRQKVQAKVKEFIAKMTADCDTELFVGCPVRFLENKNLDKGVVNGAIGKFMGVAEKGGHPIIKLKNGTLYTLSRSSSKIHLDDYTARERREIESGRMRCRPDRPVAKFTYRNYPLKMALAMTPYAVQGCTLETAVIHPNVAHDNDFTSIECVLVALSRLRSSGVDHPGRSETIRAIPKPTMRVDTSDDDAPQPYGLYLTRFAPFPFYVRPKVRNYIDNIEKHHSLLGRHEKGTNKRNLRSR